MSIVKIDVIEPVNGAIEGLNYLDQNASEDSLQIPETVEELLENKLFYLSITKIHKRFHTDLMAYLFLGKKLPQKTRFACQPCMVSLYASQGSRSLDRELTRAAPLSIEPRRL